jgi:hypothetical protein
MATPPSFTAGSVLTAAQMNSVGLWLVKTQTIGSAVSSVTVTGAFSADYDNYKIIVSGGVASGNGPIRFNFDGNTADYHSVLIFGSTGAGIGNATALGTGSIAYWDQMGYASTNAITMNMEVLAPFLTKTSAFSSYNIPTVAGSNSGPAQGFHNSATSFTGFRLALGSGTMTGGTIRVYGYRN